jgi:hypothetical protein
MLGKYQVQLRRLQDPAHNAQPLLSDPLSCQ